MGQRSQIYVRYEGKLLFASYFQWNYGERMISRARWGIEYLKEFLEYDSHDIFFSDKHYIERFKRIFDTNFDMHDVALSCDIIKEYHEQFSDEDFNESVFDKQDNNDGQLYVDIKDGKIYYALRYWAWHEDGETTEELLSAEEYMDADYEGWENSKYITDEGKSACRENIKAINEMATLMTLEQLDEFIHAHYEN